MRLGRVEHGKRTVVVLEEGGQLLCVTDLPGRDGVTDVLDVIRHPLTDEEVGSLRLAQPLPEQDIAWLAPLHKTPKNIFCVGLNYRDHLPESSQMRTTDQPSLAPVWFTKPWTSLHGHQRSIPLAPDRVMVDFEGEVAAVIGRPCSNASVDDALDHVFGYTILNDVSDRALQREREQWFLGKAGRGHAPCGPCVVTADEVGDPQKLRLRTVVSGRVRQEAATAQMINSFAQLIADLSAVVDLEPGDVIAGGTPAGVGMANGQYLQPGDEVSISVDRLGTLSTPIVEGR